ncbi:MAG: HAMP domain-containing histidine kinase, partial [Candidatus Heimdallarchaeota archaeon]
KAESQFLLDILTHDIKGYLHGSRLLLDLDLETIDKQSLSMIENNLSRINTLVERVRRYRALDRFRETVFLPMNLIEVIEKNLKDVSQSFPQNPIDFKINLDPEVEKFEILGNEFLNDIFLNIFQNAVKHHRNKPEAYFNITIKEIEKHWRISIEDDGPGIPSDQVNSLFSISTNEPPTTEKGLGHLIVRKTVAWYGGEVWAENRMIGDKIEGATIHVTLPMISAKYQKS